jgi:hypothetical protein
VDKELVAYVGRRFDELLAVLGERFAQIDARFARIEDRLAHHDNRFDELGRHFDVVAESLADRIQVVAEGVVMVDEKLSRFAAETRGEFRMVDRRLLELTARIGG